MTLPIRTLADGEKITEPGLYAISLERHHGQPCDGPSVTSGVLRKMEMETPADVWAFHLLNPNRWGKEESDALRLGAAMAYLVEGGPETLLEHFEVHPADKPRKPTAAQIEKYDAGEGTEAGILSVEYWREVEASPSRFLAQDEFDLLVSMYGVLINDAGASDVMAGLPEVTMAWQDHETGLWCLSRPDTVHLDGSVTDYKKMAASGRPFNHRLVDHRITDHGYDMQMALAAEGMEELRIGWPSIASIVAQSDKPPHHVILRGIDDEDLRLGMFRNRRARRRFAECLASGVWPGPGVDVASYQRPDWQRAMLIEQMQVEGLAP